MTICCLGDLVLDVIVRLEQPLAAGADATSQTTLGPGGQAANVAAWVAALGGRSRLVGKRGADTAGALASDPVLGLGVEIVGPLEPAGTGVIVSLVDTAGERTMCSDRGVAPDLGPEELEESWFRDCRYLHVSGYALAREPVRFAAERAVELARAGGARVSVDLSSWSTIRDVGAGRFRERVAGLRPDVVFANDEEERIVGGPIPGAHWIVKHGAGGASFGGEHRDALPVPHVADSTGAGDAFAAGWLVGGPERALEAAAACIRLVGAMPGGDPADR